MINSILAKEWFPLERERRDTPMSRCGMVLLVDCYDIFVSFRGRRDRGVKGAEIEAGPRCCARKMVAFVPSDGASVPENRSDGLGELQRTPVYLRGRAQPRQSMNIGLFGRYLEGRHILYDRIRAWKAEWYAVMESNSCAVEKNVLREIRARVFEEIWYAHCDWVDRPQPDDDIIRIHHFPRLRQREVAIWTAKREEQIDDERHWKGSVGEQLIKFVAAKMTSLRQDVND
jgi:hypothetical protein